MNVLISLVVVITVLVVGLVFTLFPQWGMRVVCRCARSYMNEDLSSDPVYVLAFRFYGMAAVGLSLYALYQVLQAF
ncbi:MAG: hypothetical protein RRA15_09890 [bacterium]|nr:hypothetical protein [bacterium]MDT8366789.1 hypothetical protein [bacterium]